MGILQFLIVSDLFILSRQHYTFFFSTANDDNLEVKVDSRRRSVFCVVFFKLRSVIAIPCNKKKHLVILTHRSRTKNMMWYGVLGTKELLQRTYKNLEQKVQLEV